MGKRRQSVRHLVVVFGDQLDTEASCFDGFDPDKDLVWMAESQQEAEHVWSNKNRIVFFFSAMRHFADQLRDRNVPLQYTELGDESRSLGELLATSLSELKPAKVVCTRPGEWRVLAGMEKVCREAKVEFEMREDRHFFSTPENFKEWARGRKSVRLEYFYRELRKRHDILMTEKGKPVGDAWNFDKDNRGSFGREGPTDLPEPPV